MEKADYGSILKKKRFDFKSNKDLQNYYEKKYTTEGYSKGYTLFGVNISNIYHKNRHNSSLELLIPRKNEIILDAGCGDGALSLRIAKKAKKIYAIDIAKNAFDKIKNKLPKNLIFKQGNIEKLNFKNQFFDKIVSVETIEHLLYPEKALKEFSRILKNNGILILTYPTIDQTIVAKIEKFLHIRDLFPVSEHLTEWDYNKVIKKTEKQGFKFIKAKGIVFDLGRLDKLKKLSKKIMWRILKFSLNKNSPKNSLFVAFEFKKI
jgi:ubiquinone/menaquinone biosynthesis C-methylase UbiE